MYIVPSGKNRSDSKKVYSQNLLADAPQERKGVEQETIGGNEGLNSSKFNPIGDLENSLKNNQKNQTKVPNKQDLDKAVNPNLKARESISRNIENIQKFKENFVQYIQQFNINMTLITRDTNKKKMIDNMFRISPSTGKGEIRIPGWWVSPEGERTIVNYSESYRELKELANNNNFDVVPVEMSMGEDVYAFDIVPLEAPVEESPALNGLEQAYGKGSFSEGKQSKSSFSKNSIIKESHNQLIASLIKRGFGGSHGS